MRGEQSPHQRNRHLQRCGDKGAGRLGRNVIPNTQEKEHEETQASEALSGGSGTVQKSQVRVLSTQHWPCRWASAPICPSVTGLSSPPAMVPCFGSFPKQHPRTHVVPPPPPTPAEVGSRVPAPHQGEPALPLKVSPPPTSNPDPQLIGNPWWAHRARLHKHTHTPRQEDKNSQAQKPTRLRMCQRTQYRLGCGVPDARALKQHPGMFENSA